MRHLWFRAFVLAAVVSVASSREQPKPSAKPETSVTGVLVGRSGKPLANAHLFLGKLADAEDMLHATLRLRGLPITSTDAQGRFKFGGFVPDTYTIVYSLAGGPTIAPAEFSIRALQAVDKSILPQMKGVEIGKTTTLDERKWSVFTLLKGHTFWGDGANMKIWNATLRRGTAGPYIEVRKGVVWEADFSDKAQIKMDAWSF